MKLTTQKRLTSLKKRKGWLSEEYAVRKEPLYQIFAYFNQHAAQFLEGFASVLNHRLQLFWTRRDNASQKTWTGLRLYLNPPFSLLDKVVTKALGSHFEESILIVPVWRTSTWWEVVELLTADHLIFKRGTQFFEFVEEDGRARNAGPLQWDVMACLLSYAHFVKRVCGSGQVGTPVAPPCPS